MSKNKLARFAENETFELLFQHTDYDIRNDKFDLKGKWHQQFFKNDHPIILEVGCGRGEYTLALARRNPECNYIGIDRKGARLWRGCKTATEEKMSNVAFVRCKIEDLECFFAPNEISEVWVTFPDPQPKKERRRLTSPRFVESYKRLLRPKGLIHLKTDSRLLYQYTLEQIDLNGWQLQENIESVYEQSDNDLLTTVQTYYEKMWLADGSLISYIRFSPNATQTNASPDRE